QRPPQVARRGGRGGAPGTARRSRDLRPLRRGCVRAPARPRVPTPRLRRQLFEDHAVEGDREGAPLPRLRRRERRPTGAHLRPLRSRGHGATERLPRRGRLLDACLERPVSRADPPPDAPPRLPGRPDRPRPNAAGSWGATEEHPDRVHGPWRPRRIPGGALAVALGLLGRAAERRVPHLPAAWLTSPAIRGQTLISKQFEGRRGNWSEVNA